MIQHALRMHEQRLSGAVPTRETDAIRTKSYIGAGHGSH